MGGGTVRGENCPGGNVRGKCPGGNVLHPAIERVLIYGISSRCFFVKGLLSLRGEESMCLAF